MQGGNKRQNMVQAVEASLQNVSAPITSISRLPFCGSAHPAEEVMRDFDDLVRAGKVDLRQASPTRRRGSCEKCNTLAELRGGALRGLQIEYSS